MVTIANTHCTHEFAPHSPVAAEVGSGDRIRFQTRDAHNGSVDISEVWSDVDFPELDDTTGNPVTGLVKIQGAHGGTTLRVTVVDISLDDVGILPVRRSFGLIRNVVAERQCRIVKVDGSHVWINKKVAIPIRPMIGTIGVAASGGGMPTSQPGYHGGNLDNNWISRGAVVDIPVFEEGALFGVGDVHAAMGDAEATCAGVDIGAEVVVDVEVVDQPPISEYPVVYKDGYIIVHGTGEDYAEASAVAIRQMMNVLVARMSVSEFEAYIMVGARGDVRPCQACRCHIPQVMSVAFPILW